MSERIPLTRYLISPRLLREFSAYCPLFDIWTRARKSFTRFQTTLNSRAFSCRRNQWTSKLACGEWLNGFARMDLHRPFDSRISKSRRSYLRVGFDEILKNRPYGGQNVIGPETDNFLGEY